VEVLRILPPGALNTFVALALLRHWLANQKNRQSLQQSRKATQTKKSQNPSAEGGGPKKTN